ncbi:DNA-binding transcriptional LysR family regulator [Pseudomonas sp. BIGb0450]|uniref:LysR family transcriptional regulator n=1 Tax=unclassified Pseudomonas TaxID=196821 RepID=UPI002167DD67|nr:MULTISPECIES: LysR family transcriptional regulator [unclassified Pseudomonas]MCS3417931.1 DNA-binding transcriptional LysR family regulator [Pseudomonas sp. BIGb0558]MCS3436134.1 DNA-binding transcriptional LysR family regulator [Pseudomonas sp. BIGb0450]
MDRLTAMETFVHVVETGSFSSAAKRMGIGQPAVSKGIAQLEARLAVRLLMRSTRGLTPTEAGLAFFEKAKRAIDEANDADDAARGASHGLSGTLRVSAGVTFSRLQIIPNLGPFLEQHPGLNVDVVLDDRLLNLVEEGIDVAMRIGNLSDSGLTARKIGQSPCRIFGTPAYFERHGEPRSPADLLHHQAVIYSLSESTCWIFTQGAHQYPVVAHGRLRVTSSEGIRAGVLSHQGVAMTAEWMFLPEIASGEVKAVLTDWELPPRDLWAVLPTGRMISAKARAFIEFVEGVLR